MALTTAERMRRYRTRKALRRALEAAEAQGVPFNEALELLERTYGFEVRRPYTLTLYNHEPPLP